jgi:glutamate/tyrosine decarboxylase-like PLP-dependent enzyme
MDFAATPEASYVQGADSTISGSRSGANAVAVWMILASYGYHSWFEKMLILQKRTDWLADKLLQHHVRFFRNDYSNIITIAADFIDSSLAARYGLVPDNHHAPAWYKIVIMEHVTVEKLEDFLGDLLTSIGGAGQD